MPPKAVTDKLEMALVKFLEIWLQWGTATATKPGLLDRGPYKKTQTDPADIAMFGTNRDFLHSITAITEDKAIEYMTAAGLSVTSVTKAVRRRQVRCLKRCRSQLQPTWTR